MSAEPASPWKQCDLRGVYPSEVSEQLFDSIGAAIGSELTIGSRVVVGGDFRASTPALKTALIEGLASTGIHVVDSGQIPTPLAYFHAAEIDAHAVFMVTASHNPAAHNGLKWMVGSLPPQPADISRIRTASEGGRFRSAMGAVDRSSPVPAYSRWLLSHWSSFHPSRLGRIVVDAGSGAWATLGPGLLEQMGCEVRRLFCQEDGTFPHRSPDCARTSNLSALRRAVIDEGASLGIAWDGDGDRVAFVDEDGVHASTDEISILLARRILGAARGSTVVCDIKLSDAVRRAVLTAGGTPLLERSGHAFMRHRLLTAQAALGLDACGHYFFREANSRDDGLFAALFVMDILTEGESLKELRRSVGEIFSTPELRLPASQFHFGQMVESLRLAFPGAAELPVDGLRLMLDDGIVLVRESSTEAVVSLRFEGFTSGGYRKVLEHSLAALGEAAPLLRRQIENATTSVPPPARTDARADSLQCAP